MKFRRKQPEQEKPRTSKRGHGKNPDYDFMFKDEPDSELDFNKLPQSPPSTVDRYYHEIRQQQSIQQLTTLDKMSIGIIVTLMGLWSMMILLIVIPLQDPKIIFSVIAVLIAYWGITWVAYYIGWKFYWFIIALGWLLATGYVLAFFDTFRQLFYRTLF